MFKMSLSLLFAVLVSASTALAGVPSQDPVIGALQGRFYDAAIPTRDQLALGKTWSCESFTAVRDQFEVNTLKLTFAKGIDGLVLLDGVRYALTEDGLGGVLKNTRNKNNYQQFFRVTEAGELIGEVSSNALPDVNTVNALVRGLRSAISYSICVLDQ